MENKKKGCPRNNERAYFIKWLRDYGYSPKEIANKLECSPESVRYFLNSRNWKYPPAYTSKCEKYAYLIKWVYDYGYTLKQIGTKFNFSPTTIYYILKKHNWPCRSAGCPRGSYKTFENGQDKFMKWLYDYGYPLRKIGPHFNYSHENIRLIFKHRNWKCRS